MFQWGINCLRHKVDSEAFPFLNSRLTFILNPIQIRSTGEEKNNIQALMHHEKILSTVFTPSPRIKIKIRTFLHL